MRDASRSVSERKREAFLEMHTQIYASMQGIALMGKALIGHLAVHEECMIVCVGQVSTPEIHLYLIQTEHQVGAQCGIELLVHVIIGLPVGLTLSLDIEAQGDAAQDIILYIETIVAVHAELMLRDERHVLVLVADEVVRIVIVVILLELGMGEAIGGTPHQVVVESLSAQGRLNTAAIALAGIVDDTSEAIVGTHT